MGLVETEGPIHKEDIYDFMKVEMNRKATKSFKTEIDGYLLNAIRSNLIERDYEFYMPNNFDFDGMKVRRRESPKIDRIHPKEIEKSIIYTLKLQYSSSKDDLIKSASTYLGFKSLRSNVKQVLNSFVQEMVSEKVLNDNNGTIELNE